MIYDKGFATDNVIGAHDAFVKNIIIDKCKKYNYGFINTTWLEVDEELEKFVKNNKKVVCYSGPDWENTICRKKQNDFIKENTKQAIYIGNSYGDHYFSFWLDFVFSNRRHYESFDTTNYAKTMVPFMCLNRKPHIHRIDLVQKLHKRNLLNRNLVSMGKFPKEHKTKGLDTPILLQTDIVNTDGDAAVSGNAGGITNDITSLGNSRNWNSHFLNIVTETTIHTNVFLSEKIFKPILGMRPFVILGDDLIYYKLQEMGFDTFDDIFGKGYKHKYYTDRIKWIVDIAEQFNKYSSKDLKKFLKNLEPRLIKNKEAFKYAAFENRKRILDLELR